MKPPSTNLNRVLSAAVVSHSFRKMLLADAAKAITSRYDDEVFSLTPEEYQLVLSIKAETLEEFAKAVVNKLGVGSQSLHSNNTFT